MVHKRKIRENPLIEYANYCGLTLERAKGLMNLMHGSNKGTNRIRVLSIIRRYSSIKHRTIWFLWELIAGSMLLEKYC